MSKYVYTDENDTPYERDAYEKIYIPREEKERMKVMSQCEHQKYTIRCSCCNHIIGSEKHNLYHPESKINNENE